MEPGGIAGNIKPPFPDWSHNFFTILLPALGTRSGPVWENHPMKKSLALACCLAAVKLLPAASPPRDLVVHEWGTFTSVQGGDGKLISWQAQQIGDLPKFVYDWIRPGRNRMTPTILTFGKGGLAGLQRMETPVIYFYSDQEFDADVMVKFPNGHITEWFPQADALGEPGPLARVTLPLTQKPTGGNLIRWQNVRVLPAKAHAQLAALLPTSTNGTHYFAARETASAFVRATDSSSTNLPVQYEKFLFYRGTGDFGTPLTVTVTEGGSVTVSNTGRSPLASLFLLQVENGAARWTKLPPLASQTQRVAATLEMASAGELQSVPKVQAELGAAMARELTRAGLFPAEARAMVKTWDHAWFTEEGVRVLYLLPRPWTDEILPLTLNPKPRELVRVMVGRAEIIPPATVKELAPVIARSNSGDAAAREQITAFVHKYGRFAGPALQLAAKIPTAPPANKPVASRLFE